MLIVYGLDVQDQKMVGVICILHKKIVKQIQAKNVNGLDV